jgi:hypothetical protein
VPDVATDGAWGPICNSRFMCAVCSPLTMKVHTGGAELSNRVLDDPLCNGPLKHMPA